MKQILLFGLTALALVFLPSCSNILEDSGNPSAITETGKLNLALEADASVSVTTKATSTVTISDEVKNNLVITGTKGGSPITLGKSSDFADGATRAVPAGTYTELSATYSQMIGDLQFDSPMLAGKTTEIVTVTPNAAAAKASITATLTNSIITIDRREKEIQKELKRLKNVKQTNIPKALAYVSGELFEQYIHDMKIVQHFAMLNRQAMMDEIVKGMKLHVEEQFTTIHNYIDTENMILRKGAVSAQAGEQLLIPINMRDGSLLCVGRGNEDWNCSAPHGAGRLMSRADAKQTFTVSEFKKQMAEVYTTSVSKATLDECPMAYKGMQDILDNIDPTADVVKIIRPIYNFKAGDED